METLVLACRYCLHPRAVRRKGCTPQGHQRYRCEACRRSFQLAYVHRAYQPGVREEILARVLKGGGVRATARALKVNMNTVMATLKKSQFAPASEPGAPNALP